jgi:hypothetical protein
MNRRTLLLLPFLCSSFTQAIQKEQEAGVLVYARNPQGTVSLLLGVQKEGRSLRTKYTWGEFKTVQQPDEPDFPRMTAARALNEGTRCYFGLEIFKKNPGQKPSLNICKAGFDTIYARLNAANLIPLTPNCSIYLMEIDWIEAAQLNAAPLIYNNGKLLPGSVKKQFMWVPYQTLLNQLKQTKNRNTAQLPLIGRVRYGSKISGCLYDLLQNKKATAILRAAA